MEALTLYELNHRVHEAIADSLSGEYWVHAEMSSVNVNTAGHCFVELVQKNEHGSGMVAKASAKVWANRFRMLRPYFEQATGQTFTAGISVLLLVTVEFHEAYGLSYIVQDIDPTYTLGDMARRRREILLRLEAEGTLNLNKELVLPMLPRRVAVISSATAAGYGDFCHQLASNPYGFSFQTKLFPAVMQGDRVEESIIVCLEALAEELDNWDVVVIIRGGGATSDLAGFDTYRLASNVAQFPLPVVTGIGHERDDTVLDAVAHTRVKTPTAAAEFLVACMVQAAEHLQTDVDALTNGIRQSMATHQQRLERLAQRLPIAFALRRTDEEHRLDRACQRTSTALERYFLAQQHRLALAEKVLQAASPEHILRQGYSITYRAGKAVRSAADLQADEVLTTQFADGVAYSKVLLNPNTDTE